MRQVGNGVNDAPAMGAPLTLDLNQQDPFTTMHPSCLTLLGYSAKLPTMERRLDKATRARLDAQARVMKALAHPTRLFIVEELSRGERCVCELTEMVGADVSTVSKHLALLRTSGLVQDDKRGTNVYYSLRCACAMSFFHCIDEVLQTVARQHAEVISA